VLDPDCRHGTERHLTSTAGRDANVVEVELLIASTKESADRVDVRPLLDAVRARCEQRVYELARRPAAAVRCRRVGRSLVCAIVAAHSLVERLREVRCLEQLDDEALSVDGEGATVALRGRRAAVHVVVAVRLEQSVSSQVDHRVTTVLFQPSTTRMM